MFQRFKVLSFTIHRLITLQLIRWTLLHNLKKVEILWLFYAASYT